MDFSNPTGPGVVAALTRRFGDLEIAEEAAAEAFATAVERWLAGVGSGIMISAKAAPAAWHERSDGLAGVAEQPPDRQEGGAVVRGCGVRTEHHHGRASGRQGAERVAESLFAAFPDLHFEINATVVQDETVMCEMTMTGTHLGTPALPVLGGHLTNATPTGRQIRQHQMHLYRVVEGQIVEHRAVRDDLGLMEQLGIIARAPNREADISRLDFTSHARD